MLQHITVVALSDVTHNPSTTPHVMANSLDGLVDDILIQILQALSVHAVLSLRKVSPILVDNENEHAQRETRRLGGTIYSPNSAASGMPDFAPTFLGATYPYPVPRVPSPCSPRRSSNDARCERSTSTMRGHVCLPTSSCPSTTSAWTKWCLFRAGRNY